MWNQIEESVSEDETLGSSFFTNGLFKISNEEKSTKDPTVLSLLQKKRLIVAVNNSLVLLDDCNTIDCKFIAFGAGIDCFAVSHNGDYVVCCLSDGNIQGIHIKGIPLFNQTINDDDVNSHENRTFIDIKSDASGKYFILCSNGSIYEMLSIDDQELNTNISADYGDATCLIDQTSMFAPPLDRVSSHRITSKISSFCYVPSVWGYSFIVSCADYIVLIDDCHVSKINYPNGGEAIVKLLNLDNFILGLTETHKLVEICAVTNAVRKIQIPDNIMIEDIRVVETNQEFIELLITSKLNHELSMKVVDFPSFKTKSEINLPANSWIVSQSKETGANMYFIEGYKNENDFIQTIEIKCITDTDPEQRFTKLLMRGQFDEAEEFAKTCGLSLEPLHKMKVRKTLLELSTSRNMEDIEENFKILMKQLASIEDKAFLVNLRGSAIPDRSSLTKFLEYILKNINTNDFPNETNEINELLLRLETLRLIDPDDTNLRWQKFLEERDMQKAAIEYFKTDVLLSCLVWSRHASSIIPNMNMKHFYAWLSRIPNTIEPFHIIQWLKHFAPCFLQAYPQETTKLIDWCLERTRALQFSPAWPEIGLEFINNINVIFEEMKFMFVDIRRFYHCNMEKIQKLINTLEEMVVLKQTYHLIISLDDYSRNSIEETAFKLLQRIQIMNLAKMVNDFLYPIFMERGLAPEETIVRYINFLANNKNLGFWQDRAVVAIDLLNNEENRLNCALLILKVSPVPWSDAVMPLAKLGTTSSHPIAQSILIEYKSQAIKIIKIKYGWPVDYFDFQQDRIQLVFRILKMKYPEMIKDIKTLIETSPDITQDAYINLNCRLVELGKLDELCEVISELNNENEQQQIILKSIEVFIAYLDNDMVKKENIESYFEALKYLISNLKDSVDDFKFCYQKGRVKKIRNVMNLRETFGIDLKLSDLHNGCTIKLNETIKILTDEINNSKSVNGIWKKAQLISRSFDLSILQVYNLIAKKLNNIFVTCHLIESYCATTDLISENKEIESAMESCVLMISQQIIYFENNFYNFNALHYDPLAFPLAFELLSKCLNQFDSNHHKYIIDLLYWIEIIRCFYPRDVLRVTASNRKIDSTLFAAKKTNGHANGYSNINKRESLSIFDQFGDDHFSIPTLTVKKQFEANENLRPIIECVCYAIKVVTFVMQRKINPYKLFQLYLENEDENQLKDNFTIALQALMKLKLNMSVFVIIQLILNHQKASNVLVLPPYFVTQVHQKILKYMLSQKEPEYIDAFIILRSELNQIGCLDYLKQNLKNNSQRIAFSTFSEMYNKYKNSNECVVDREARLKLYYYSELCKQYPNLKAPNNLDSIGISEFLKDLEKRQLNIELLKKLCKDFGWSYQKKLVQQIKIVLSHQKLDFEVKTDEFGKDDVVIKSNVESIKKLCMSYLTEVTEMDHLGSELEKFFIEEINVYFYELYLAVIDLIEHAKELSHYYRFYRSILMLLRLKLTFKRRSISPEEHEHWAKNAVAESGVLPVISNYRLPFTLLIRIGPENIIGKDLNVESFETYYPLISMHAELGANSPEDISNRIEACSASAAKNSILDLQSQAEATPNNWNLKPRSNALLQAALRMVNFLQNKTKILATLYGIMINTPRGCDQMEAAYECYKFVLANEQELKQNPKYHDLVEKAKVKYPLLKTQHLLYLYGVYDEKLIQFVDNPPALINALYHHDSILKSQKKEINKLCSELADLHNIDLLSLQNKLLQNWLAFAETSANENMCGDETVYEDFMGNNGNEDNGEDAYVSDENVVRAYYILSSWNNETAFDFLAGELNSSSAGAENQMQLYECFAKLMNESSLSYMEVVDADNYLITRVCHYLKGLGINKKAEQFQNCDKVDLLKAIWTSHFNNPKGLEVMALICLSYNIHMPQIWNGVLKQMVLHKMIKHLSILVEILSTKTKLLHLLNLKLAWEYVIQDPLIHASKIKSYENDLKITKTFIALQKCPISTFLNLTGFAEKCMLLERPHMAAIFTAFAKESDREKIIKMLANCDKNELKKNIDELEEFGIAPVITKAVINFLRL